MKRILLSFSFIFAISLLVLSVTSCKKPTTTPTTYTVKFMYKNELLKEETVKQGENATAPEFELPGYELTGWSENLVNVQSDLTIYPVLVEKVYTVTYMVDGELFAERTCKYGSYVVPPVRPTKEGYNFIKWDSSSSNITEDKVINAVFEKEEYKVEFLDPEGNVISTQYVLYLESATAPKIELSDNYIFHGWDTDFSEVKDDLEVKALYEKIGGTITYWFNGQQLDLSPNNYSIGEVTELPIPELDGYYFDGWYLSEISRTKYTHISETSTGDFNFQASFIETEKHNLLTLPDATYHFTGIKKVKHSSGDFYVYQPEFPAGATLGATQYNWSTSDTAIATVSAYSSITINSNGYCILTATLKDNPNYTINCIIKTTIDGITVVSEEEANTIELCTVKFVGKDGELISETICQKGGHVVLPVPYIYENYRFIGWDKENYNIQEDTTIQAQYEYGYNKFTGKSFAILGDSISTYLNYIPEGFAHFYPYPTGDVIDYNMTWWMQVINRMGGTLFVNNSWGGTCVAAGGNAATQEMGRLEPLVIDGEAPDVILIYMGSNDCASGAVDETLFSKGYSKMLDNLKKLCPNSEIILCTLATNKLYDESKKVLFNKIIVEKASEYNLELLDLSDISFVGHLLDSAHPGFSGMQLMADKVVEELLKLK